jgi:hypothetical protein
MTVEYITSGFRATGLTPFDPERVLEKLSPVICYGRVSGCRRYVGMVADRSDTELCTYR